jgi:signal recognition particle receptor subunit beta
MVFFNYSTMQMAAKVVYYGPGLCGKTTNLHYIYGHTTTDSRGEMVSLETETDRTLFFDLLPIDVGSIAGFNTRIQLYTVPGQVFYNTTRKLVLKGVDGVVFVVDSQRAMRQANLDSFRNLDENLREMGLSVDSLPLVLQYNKRDLTDIYSVEELNQTINRNHWPHFEASALSGQGVFETLKGISKFTLLALKKRLGRSGPEASAPPSRVTPVLNSGGRSATPASTALSSPPSGVSGVPSAAASSPMAPESAAAPMPPLARPAAGPLAQMPPSSPSSPSLAPLAPLAPNAAAPPPSSMPAPRLVNPAQKPAVIRSSAPAAPAPAAPAPAAAAPAAPAAAKRTSGIRRSVDVLGELEKLRREAMQPAAGAPSAAAARVTDSTLQPAAAAAAHAKASGNGRAELSRSIEMTLKRSDFARAKRFLVSFQVEDDQQRVVDSVRDLKVEIQGAASLEKLLLRLNIALHSKE